MDLKQLYSFTDSRDPDRILNRLKRLDAKTPRLQGGKSVSMLGVPGNVARLRELQQKLVRRYSSNVRETGDGNTAG